MKRDIELASSHVIDVFLHQHNSQIVVLLTSPKQTNRIATVTWRSTTSLGENIFDFSWLWLRALIGGCFFDHYHYRNASEWLIDSPLIRPPYTYSNMERGCLSRTSKRTYRNPSWRNVSRISTWYRILRFQRNSTENVYVRKNSIRYVYTLKYWYEHTKGIWG